MIPLPHDIKVLKVGEPDIWGKPAVEKELELKGNIRSRTQVVTNNQGEEVISNYRILLRRVVDVRMSDKIRFVEANGEVVESEPIQVKFIRDLDGSVAYTKVVL